MDNLLQTLRFLVKDHPIVSDCQLITVCQNSLEFLPFNFVKEFDDLKSHFARADHFDMELDEMSLPIVTNWGVDYADSNKVIILESDRILPSGYFNAVIDQIGPSISITCSNMKKLTKPATDDEIRSASFEYKDESRSDLNRIGVRNMWSGNTAIWKPDYIRAGKMDESYIGYGWADSDMTNRMKMIGVLEIFRPEIELHLWHPSATYGKSDQKALFIKNGINYCRRWDVEHPDWFKEEIAAQHRKIPI